MESHRQTVENPTTYDDCEYLLSFSTLKDKYFNFSNFDPIGNLIFDLSLQDNLNKISKKTWHAWDVVHGQFHDPTEAGNIILSIIPNIHQQKKKTDEYCSQLITDISTQTSLPLGLVISCVDPFELFFSNDIISPITWNKHGIKHYHLPMTDFKASASEDQMIHAALAAIKTYMDGKSVLVHCKAGKSRSLSEVLVIIAILIYLYKGIKYNDIHSIQQLVERIREYRIQIDLGSNKLKMVQKTLQTFYQSVNADFPDIFFKKRHFEIEFNKMNYSENMDYNPLSLFKELLHSLELKNALVQTSGFKAIAGYISKFFKANRADHLGDFLLTILNSKNDDWFSAFMKDEMIEPKANDYLPYSELTQFLHSQPGFRKDDIKARQDIVSLFKNNLKEVICEIAHLSPQDLQTLLEMYEDEQRNELVLTKKIWENPLTTDDLNTLESYKNLIKYTKETKPNPFFKTKRAEHLENFILYLHKEMNAKSSAWIFYFLSNHDLSINHFLSAKAKLKEDHVHREKLINAFKADIIKLLLSKFDCKPAYLDKIIRQEMQLIQKHPPSTSAPQTKLQI